MRPDLSSRKRLVGILVALLFLFSLLMISFFKIQIVEGQKWLRRARAQHHLVVTEPFKRGLFYSNTALKAGHPETAQPFVVDIPKFHLFADPQNIPAALRKEVAARVATLLALKGQEAQKLGAQLEKQSRSRKLALWLGPEQMEQVRAWWGPYARAHKLPSNALFFVRDYQRSYPFGKLLGQVLHTVREEKDHLSHQPIPTGGLEFIFDRILRGKEGKRLLLRSPRHALETGQVLSLPEDGADVYLTVNHYLQAVAEEEIARAVQQFNAKGGWAILMEPRTGEIFALAQYPYFEPARYRDYFNDPGLLEHTKVKALTDPFEPGSTMKPLTLVLALKANAECAKRGKPPIFSPDEKIATASGVFPGRSKPIRDVKTHAYLNMDLALQKSSNIYMARLAQRIVGALGDKWYRDALEQVFGFGNKTGIELPSESPGHLPVPGRLHKNGTMEWSTPTPFSLAFGHNLLANSLQMLRAYAILANGGYDVKPTLVRMVMRQEEVLLDNTGKERVEQSVRLIEPEIVSRVVRAMREVTQLGGTARKANIPGYTEAGKTSTSEKIVGGQYSSSHHIATFLGFAPVTHPRFVLMVVLDEPEAKVLPSGGKNQHAGNCCAPAFAAIGLKTLQYLGVAPDDPENTDFVREAKELKELYQKWNAPSKN